LVSAKIANKRKIMTDKLIRYKNYIKYIDILIILLTCAGAILSIYEHEYYYYDNMNSRVVSVLIMNYVRTFPGMNNISSVFNSVNLVELTDFTNMTGISKNYLLNTHNFTNKHVLETVNITEIGYYENMTDYEKIIIPLTISDYCQKLRIFILILTIASCIYYFY
jgi:hypothetical protein